jgi:alpha-L-fucosidase
MQFWKTGMFFAMAVTLPLTCAWAQSVLKWESPATKDKVDKKITETEGVIQKGPFKDDLDSLQGYQVPDWYRDAKFGIFIHWGLYSVPGYANEWYSRNMYQQGDDAFKHQVATYGPQTKFGYKDFAPLFKAEKFDPSYWAKLFKEAGAKYVVPVAEHHDGFAMYDSDFSDWTAVKKGPRRDVIGDLAKAVREQGLVFGLSYHRAEHWWFMNGGMKFDSDVQDPLFADFYGPAMPDDTAPDDDYLRNWQARSCELVDKYHPQLVYFDWWVGEKPVFAPYLKKFTAYYYDQAAQWGQGVVLNTKDKAFMPGTAVQDVEKGKLPGINPVPWQTDTSVSWRSWAYLKDDQLKDSTYLIQMLIDVVSRNGNLLLDIGPKPDGTIPEGQEKVLREIGDWLKVNGEAIYGTRPWVAYGEGPTGEGGGKFSEQDVKYQEGDLRFTRKGNALYIISMVPLTKPLVVKNLSQKLHALKVLETSLLGSPEKINWKQDDSGLTLDPPQKKGSIPVVYKVLLEGYAYSDLKLTSKGLGFAAETTIQCYVDKPFPRIVRIFVNGKQADVKTVVISPDSDLPIRFDIGLPKPGLYHVSLGNAGSPSLEGTAALPSIGLTGEWLFNKGDDATWSKPGLKDSGWEKVKLPAKWADHGYPCENCWGWYRKHLVIPKEWKGHSIVLPLGKIDDADVTYLNGKQIGGMGTFPPSSNTAWDQVRRYEVPANLIRFGKDNVIAIRVYNGSGGAGLYDGPLGPIEVK